jgi:hypothetical protein
MDLTKVGTKGVGISLSTSPWLIPYQLFAREPIDTWLNFKFMFHIHPTPVSTLSKAFSNSKKKVTKEEGFCTRFRPPPNMNQIFYKHYVLPCSQIWLDPLVDGCKCGYTTPCKKTKTLVYTQGEGIHKIKGLQQGHICLSPTPHLMKYPSPMGFTLNKSEDKHYCEPKTHLIMRHKKGRVLTAMPVKSGANLMHIYK